MINNSLYSSNSDEWYTPKNLFNELNEEFHFTLDPCCSENSILIPKYYTKKDNGLIKSWQNEIVFCNPPYSQIKSWCQKCSYEYNLGNCVIVLLIPARTDTKYFHDFILPYAAIRFIKGRLKFSNSNSSAPFPSILCIFK